MLCLKSSAKNLLALTTLGCLGLVGLTLSPALSLVESSVDNDSGRGSGRITQQVPQTSHSNQAISYRGTGRLQNSDEPTTANRGSGRIETQDAQSIRTAYRGSGRISPVTLTLPDYA
jgi:hypothetical protein